MREVRLDVLLGPDCWGPTVVEGGADIPFLAIEDALQAPAASDAPDPPPELVGEAVEDVTSGGCLGLTTQSAKNLDGFAPPISARTASSMSVSTSRPASLLPIRTFTPYRCRKFPAAADFLKQQNP